MKVYAALAVLALAGCTAETPTPPSATSHVEVVDHSLAAFGGRLLGTDRGEWIGRLVFEAQDGTRYTLLGQNVLGIVRNSSGVYVFTGLAHLGSNEGFIYHVAPAPGGHVTASLLGRLPGTPSNIVQDAQQVTSFLVSAGQFDSTGREVFRCLRLVGEQVQPGHACLPPRRLGSNNSSKPTPLRGAAKFRC